MTANIKKITSSWALLLLVLSTSTKASGNEPQIIAAEFTRMGTSWRIAVELRHQDSGWEHYADAWRLVTASGTVLATRILRHPHVDEQPFTRSLAGVEIPNDVKVVFIEAHDKVHGWAKKRLRVDLSSHTGDQFRVDNKP